MSVDFPTHIGRRMHWILVLESGKVHAARIYSRSTYDSLVMFDDSEEEEDEEGESSAAAETLNLLSRTTSSAARPTTSPRSAPELSRDDDW